MTSKPIVNELCLDGQNHAQNTVFLLLDVAVRRVYSVLVRTESNGRALDCSLHLLETHK